MERNVKDSMKISLERFESTIDERIVNRGSEYFADGAVGGLKQIKDGVWVASVEGTEKYKVRINLKGDEVAEHSCSCPYDLGPVCKHIVAVLYELRDQQYGQKKRIESSKKSSKNKSPKKPQASLEEIISQMPRASLNALLLDYAGREPDLIDYIFAKHALQASVTDKEHYQQIIRNTVDSARGRHGFIGYWESSKAVEGAEMILDKAQEFISDSEAQKALPIYQCVLEEMVPLLQDADDSNGCIGGVIDQAFEGLSICARLANDKVFREELLNYLFNEFESKRYEGWSEWRWNFLELAAQVVETTQEQKRLFEKLDQTTRSRKGDSEWSGRYNEETIRRIKLTVAERLGTEKDVEDFLNQHIENPDMRERSLERAFERKDFTLVKQLAKDGIVLDEKQKIGRFLINGWTGWLLRAAQAERNIPEIKEHSLALFLKNGDLDYYRIYKKCFSKPEWVAEVERVIGLLKKSGEDNEGTLAQIFIQEERWDDLLVFVQQDVNAYVLEAYKGYLDSRYPKELAAMYEKVIIEELAPLVGRNHYQRVGQFLRQMKKIGAQERVKALMEEMSNKYKNRPAFLEEITRV